MRPIRRTHPLARHSSLLSPLFLCLALGACSQDVPDQSGKLELSNLTVTVDGAVPPGLFNDWLTMSRIADIPRQERPEWGNLKVQDAATLRLSNSSSEEPLYLTALTVDTGAFTLERPPLPLKVEPESSYDLEVRFVASFGEKGVRRGALQIASSGGAASVQLAGVFMERPEGDSEVNLQQIVDAFGYTTDIGLVSDRLSETPDSPLAGDEVRAAFWERADPEKPVYVRELATYHGCCDEENFIELVAQSSGESLGRVVHAASYAQSVRPLNADETGPAEMSVQPTAAFEIVVGAVDETYSTDTDGNLGVRLWPVKNRAGDVIPDAYIVAEDYVQNGCGEGNANCDYQDNVFLITNVQPAQ